MVVLNKDYVQNTLKVLMKDNFLKKYIFLIENDKI